MEPNLYHVSFSAFVREFKGQLLGPKLTEKIEILCDSSEEFNLKLFVEAIPHLKQQVIAKPDDVVEWTLKEAPDNEDNIDHFVIIFDSVSQCSYAPSGVDEGQLQSWQSKDGIHVYLHMYSLSIGNSALFCLVKKQLLTPTRTDRAGAASNQLEREMETHRHNYIGTDLNFQLWANHILSSEPHLQEAMAQQGPPIFLA
ncbi:hypothetical protein HK096_006310 [Nowakowskiella sp. JEL0078]|nr:hypothetical protein HK096_006310 [Nowakowskiella sp. JEL0078]